MPYEFFFKSTERDTPNFAKRLESMRCEGMVSFNRRCSNIVTIGLPYCENHRLSDAHVQIMKSPGKGSGLYAFCHHPARDAPVFKRGDVVLRDYIGEHITKRELERRYGSGDTYNAPYTIALDDDTFVDAACKRGLSSIINHAKAYNSKDTFIDGYRYANCVYRYRRDPPGVYIEATRDIFHTEELLVDYGGDATSMSVDDSPMYTNPPDIETGTRSL